jgi:hypothetical protein
VVPPANLLLPFTKVKTARSLTNLWPLRMLAWIWAQQANGQPRWAGDSAAWGLFLSETKAVDDPLMVFPQSAPTVNININIFHPHRLASHTTAGH